MDSHLWGKKKEKRAYTLKEHKPLNISVTLNVYINPVNSLSQYNKNFHFPAFPKFPVVINTLKFTT